MKLELRLEHQTIGLLFSGGIDSSLLLYMLGLQYPERRIMAFSAGCSYIDNRVHMPQIQNVFDRVTNLVTPGALDYHIVHYHDDRTTHHCNQAMQEFDPMVDIWITGMNKAPPVGTTVNNAYGDDVDIHETCPLPHRKEPIQKWQTVDGYDYYVPLADLDKQDIIRLYKHFEIYHSVLPLTRSCPKTWEFHEMKHFTAECGDCFWCLEKKWGMMV